MSLASVAACVNAFIIRAFRFCHFKVIPVFGRTGMFWEEDEGREWQGLSCGYRAVTGSLARPVSTEGSDCSGTAAVLWCRSSWASQLLQRTRGTGPVGCLIASMCVLYEYLCVGVHLCGDVHVGVSLFPQLLFSTISLTGSLLCVHLSILPLPSVCYLQPSCHISPLPATFLLISEEVTYLCLERRLLACDL